MDVVDFMELLDLMCNQIMFDNDKKSKMEKRLDKRIFYASIQISQ